MNPDMFADPYMLLAWLVVQAAERMDEAEEAA